MAEPNPHARPRETEAAVRLSEDLLRSLRKIVGSPPFKGLGPIEIARVLGVDKTLASRLMSALRATDPLVALSLLPGVSPLRQFLAAARRQGAAARTVEAAERKLRAYDLELARTFGTRTRLDALIADALPEARRRHGDVARQAVYRGMALIKGVSIDLENFTWIVHPSASDRDRVDLLFLGAFVGVQRLRPTARFRVGASYSRQRPEEGPQLLRPFCRPPQLSITTSTSKDYVYYEISRGPVRRDAAADVFLHEYHPSAASRIDPALDKGLWWVGDVLQFPVKRLELTLLIHEDVWRGCDFSLRVYDTAGRGFVHLPDPERDFDLVATDAEVVSSVASADALRASAVPDYAKILGHLVEPLGWSLQEERGRPRFRKVTCEIAYPLYGGQIVLLREAAKTTPRRTRRGDRAPSRP